MSKFNRVPPSRLRSLFLLIALTTIGVVISSHVLPPSWALTNGGSITALGVPLTENFDSLSQTGLKTIMVGSFVSPKYTPQMAEIVKYVEQLNELDIDDVDPMLGGLTDEGEVTVTTREDVVRPSLSQDDALSQAPSPVAGHFQVPKVL